MAIIHVHSGFRSRLRYEPGYWKASFDVGLRG
jgi:hypothetical protein